jgi:hypothetical protein
LNEEVNHTEKYPPQNLIEWMKRKYDQEQQEKWKKFDYNNERAHSSVMDKEPSPECPFCAENLTIDHIL